MAFQALNGGFYWPDEVPSAHWALLSNSELLIDASGEKVAFIFVAPKTGNIDQLSFYIKTKTTNGTLTLTLETIDATNGRPSGTLVGTGATGTFSNTASNQVAVVTFGATLPAVTKGTQYAAVISQAAGSCTVLAVTHSDSTKMAPVSRLVYTLHNTGSWSTTSASPALTTRPNLAIRYDDTAYYYTPGIVCVSAFAQSAFNNTSATRERGLAFTLPFPARVSGFFLNANNVQSDYTVVLANAGGALATFSGDKDQSSFYTAGTNYGGTIQGYFSSTVDLAASTKYYLTLVPQSATNVSLHEATILDSSVSAQMGMWNGGTAAVLVTRDSGGAYTETATQRPYGMGIIVSAFDDAVSGGGGGLAMAVGGPLR
jgi:hypothetical protein